MAIGSRRYKKRSRLFNYFFSRAVQVLPASARRIVNLPQPIFILNRALPKKRPKKEASWMNTQGTASQTSVPGFPATTSDSMVLYFVIPENSSLWILHSPVITILTISRPAKAPEAAAAFLISASSARSEVRGRGRQSAVPAGLGSAGVSKKFSARTANVQET